MIPYTGKYGPRYYIKGKPNPWGFKVWTLASDFGIVYNFDVCTAPTKQQPGWPDMGSSSNTVCKLTSLVPQHLNHKLILDNLFSSIPLFMEMFKRGILCMGTVRANILIGIDMITEN